MPHDQADVGCEDQGPLFDSAGDGVVGPIVEVAIQHDPIDGFQPPHLEGPPPVAGTRPIGTAHRPADVDTTTFGPAGARLAHRNGPHPNDSNHDGIPDLLAHFLSEETGILPGDQEPCETGETLDGTVFEGCDTVRMVPPK